MLAVAHAQRGEHAEAIVHLERAIAVNPNNRAIARQDSDFEPLEDDDAFRVMVTPPPTRIDHPTQRPPRPRSAS
jgi:tetratricopeptide (TPR) repeat protein